jgi:hypothetical protein
MNFKKDNGSITLESIKDDGTELNITGYTDKELLTIGADGKYTGISAEPSGTEESGNKEVNLITQADNQVITTQDVEPANNEGNTLNDANTLDEACKTPECESIMKKINAAHEKLNKQTNTTLAIEDDTVIEEEASKVLNNNGNLNITDSKINPDVSDKRNNSNNQQQLDITNSPNQGGKTKRRKAGKKNKSKRVRFMSRRNRRR